MAPTNRGLKPTVLIQDKPFKIETPLLATDIRDKPTRRGCNQVPLNSVASAPVATYTCSQKARAQQATRRYISPFQACRCCLRGTKGKLPVLLKTRDHVHRFRLPTFGTPGKGLRPELPQLPDPAPRAIGPRLRARSGDPFKCPEGMDFQGNPLGMGIPFWERC